jgi:2-polyprenyl-3-methyl-5-hydroxy-6-metoxy-1,4-benzoquinol methylase
MSAIARPRAIDVNLRSGPQMREYSAISERVVGERAGRVLDWGCGHGQVTNMLHEQGVDVVGFDYREGSEPKTIQIEIYPDIEVHVSGDPVLLPFADGEFDIVLSCGVLEHVQRPTDSLREIRRVLRPGGRLLIYKLPNRFSYLEAIARRTGMYYHGAHPDDRVYDRQSATALLEAQGYTVDDFRRTNMLPLTMQHPLAWRFRGAIWSANCGLARVPGVSLLATNLELDASAP